MISFVCGDRLTHLQEYVTARHMIHMLDSLTEALGCTPRPTEPPDCKPHSSLREGLTPRTPRPPPLFDFPPGRMAPKYRVPQKRDGGHHVVRYIFLALT